MDSQELKDTKSELRQVLKERRKALSLEARKMSSELICKHLIQLLEKLEIGSSQNHLAIYQAMKYEVKLDYLLEYAHNYAFSVPIVLGPRQMEFLEVRPKVLLAPKDQQPDFLAKPAAKASIPEGFRQIHASEISALVLPGLGFDKQGLRLGYGGGFYDSYISEHADELLETPKIALAFDEQILEGIPKGAHDRPVDYIVTPSEIIKPIFQLER